MGCLLNFGAFSGIFAVPNDVVDKYLTEATSDDVKVLLYILRKSTDGFNSTELCSALGLSKEAAGRSVEFWAKRGIFSIEKQQADSEEIKQESKRKAPVREKKILSESVSYSPEDISRKSKDNEELRFLLSAASDMLGRLLSPADCSSLVYLYDAIGLPADVILMVLEYCVSTGKNSIKYIEKTACGWAEEGVDSHELAEEKIRQLEARRTFEGQVKSIMGIAGRALSQTERACIIRWQGEWKSPLELVKLAYDICVDRTGKLSVSYINSILKAWHDKGIENIEQAQNEKSRSRNAKSAPSYSIDEYVRLSMKRLQDD